MWTTYVLSLEAIPYKSQIASVDVLKSNDIPSLTGQEWYPKAPGKSIRHGKYMVVCRKAETVEGIEDFHRYTLQIIDPDGVTTIMTKYHFSNWTDFGAAEMSQLNAILDRLEADLGPNYLEKALVDWNCRASVGRSGTLFVMANLHYARSPKTPLTDEDLYKTIALGKIMRSGQFVQSSEQLELLQSYVQYLNDGTDV